MAGTVATVFEKNISVIIRSNWLPKFQDPMPKRPWQPRILYANGSFSKWCPQAGSFDPGSQDEDCLYLNVFTPRNLVPRSGQLFPVMFWIHGGAFEVGTAAEFLEEAMLQNLVSKGVVVVSINYRLGALGKKLWFQLPPMPSLQTMTSRTYKRGLCPGAAGTERRAWPHVML